MFVLLTSDNVSSRIGCEMFPLREQALEAMIAACKEAQAAQAWRCERAEENIDEEAGTASVCFSGSEDLFYWQIKELHEEQECACGDRLVEEKRNHGETQKRLAAAESVINAMLRECKCETRHQYCARAYEPEGCDSDTCADACWCGTDPNASNAPAAVRTNATEVIVVVNGGLVSSVYASPPGAYVHVDVLDYDNLKVCEAESQEEEAYKKMEAAIKGTHYHEVY